MATIITTNKRGENFCYFFRPYSANGVCSNWYTSSFIINNTAFSCVEQYMMYRKAMLFKDAEVASKILLTNNPKEIKALGRKVKNFNEETWKEHRMDIVCDGVLQKFKQNSKLNKWMKDLYKQYGDNLLFVEASPYDRIWGIGREVDDTTKNWTTYDFRGQNLLGEALTWVYTEGLDK